LVHYEDEFFLNVEWGGGHRQPFREGEILKRGV